MTTARDMHDDEIDLFELAEIIWAGKWVIIGLSLLAGALGFGVAQLKESEYRVSVPYVVNVYSVDAQQVCGQSNQCMAEETSKKLTVMLEDNWTFSRDSTLSLTTADASVVSRMTADLDRVNELLTQETYDAAVTELTWIESELIDAVLGTEIIATNFLNAKRVIAAIESGERVLSFGQATVANTLPVVRVTVVMSILGAIVAVFVVFIWNAIQSRKQQLRESA